MTVYVSGKVWLLQEILGLEMDGLDLYSLYVFCVTDLGLITKILVSSVRV